MHAFTQELLDADHQKKPLSSSKAQPQTSAEAEAIQLEFSDALGGHGGWKMTPWSSSETMLASPVPKAWIHRSPSALRPPHGARIEVEFMLLRDGTDWQVGLAFEFLRTRLTGVDWTPMSRRADLLAGGGIIWGKTRPLDSLPGGEGQLTLTHSESPPVVVTTKFDKAAIHAASDWLIGHAEARGRPILPGMVVLTSARIGPLVIAQGSYRASWPGLDDTALVILDA